MKKILLICLLFMLAAMPAMAEHVISNEDNPSYIFVMSAQTGSFEGETLTLNGILNVVYFTDRPNRIAGHMSLQDLMGNWDKGPDSFEVDPPNATLSIVTDRGNNNVILEIIDPQMTGDSLVFRTRILDGQLPGTFNQATLFIDPINQNGQWTGT